MLFRSIQRHVLGTEEDSIMNNLATLKSREKEKLPDENDVQGAAYGIVRLYSLYEFRMDRFVKEGIISTTLDDGTVVLSEASVLKLNSNVHYL